MQKIEFLTIFLLLLIGSMFSASAYFSWNQEANADLFLTGSNGFIGFSSNQNNRLVNISYSKCNLPSSLYTPVSTDLDGDGTQEFILSTSSGIEIYTSACSFVNSLNLGESPNAMPLLNNFDGDEDQEIVILTDDNLEFWSFKNNTFTNEKNINYSTLQPTPLTELTCSRETIIDPLLNESKQRTCTGFSTTGDQKVYLFYYHNDTVIEKDILTGDNRKPLGGYGGIASTRSGVSESREWYSVICNNIGAGSTNVSCDIINHTGTQYSQFSLDPNTVLGVTSFSKHDVYIGKLQGLLKVFYSVDNNRKNCHGISDINGNFIVKECDGSNNYSNYAIGDYDKDGINEACLLIENSSGVYFDCYDSAGNTEYSENMTSVMNFSNIVIADFVPNKTTLGIGSVEGIFYTTPERYLTSGIYQDGTYLGNLMVVSSASSGSPIMVYTDDTTGFMIENRLVSASCGNGICEDFESAFSCPSDCGIPEEEDICYSDDDCTTANPTCLSGKCVRGFNESLTCNFNSDCPLTSPICFASYCLEDVEGVVPGTTSDVNETNTNAEYIEAIRTAMDMIFAGNTALKFALGLVATIILSILIIQAIGGSHPIIVMLLIYLVILLLTGLTLFPIAVPVLVAVIMLLLAFASKFLGSSGNNDVSN